MKNVLFAAAIATATLAGATSAMASGLPHFHTQSLTSTAASGVVGEAYPVFQGPNVPVTSQQSVSNLGNED